MANSVEKVTTSIVFVEEVRQDEELIGWKVVKKDIWMANNIVGN